MASSQLTLVSVLERAATVYPRAEIVSQRSDGTTLRYRYADFYRRARALAAALQECGLHHCDRVATLMSNHHIQLEASFGVPVAGGMLHALNPHLPAQWLDVLDALDREPQRWTLAPGTRIVAGGATAPANMVQRFDAHRVRVIPPRAMTLPIATNSIPELEENISSSSVNAI